MDTIREGLVWANSLPVFPKIIISTIAVLICIFVLTIFWGPPIKGNTLKDTPGGSTKISQHSSGQNNPNVSQQGRNNISQIGNNNQATIVDREHLILDDVQQAALTAELRAFSGRKVKIFLNRETQETLKFSRAMSDAMTLAGIQVVEISDMYVLGAMPQGLLFYLTKNDPTDRIFAEALASAFVKIGVVKDKVAAEYANNDIFIIYITPFD